MEKINLKATMIKRTTLTICAILLSFGYSFTLMAQSTHGHDHHSHGEEGNHDHEHNSSKPDESAERVKLVTGQGDFVFSLK